MPLGLNGSAGSGFLGFVAHRCFEGVPSHVGNSVKRKGGPVGKGFNPQPRVLANDASVQHIEDTVAMRPRHFVLRPCTGEYLPAWQGRRRQAMGCMPRSLDGRGGARCEVIHRHKQDRHATEHNSMDGPPPSIEVQGPHQPQENACAPQHRCAEQDAPVVKRTLPLAKAGEEGEDEQRPRTCGKRKTNLRIAPKDQKEQHEACREQRPRKHQQRHGVIRRNRRNRPALGDGFVWFHGSACGCFALSLCVLRRHQTGDEGRGFGQRKPRRHGGPACLPALREGPLGRK
jgi:hypothetical protein